jgi:hypothetical protein
MVDLTRVVELYCAGRGQVALKEAVVAELYLVVMTYAGMFE